MLKANLNKGSAKTSYSIRGELVFNGQNDKTKKIDWHYREHTANINWTNNDIAVINGHSIAVPHGKFDYRNQ
ncbi:DUF5412 family protein [Alkalihalophilus marmarensis]|uniref:DUF5412 family protein n=1 Tax=Alkalihalophilus marmarensis TaxID=521377 RepID=UPI002DBFD93E|nr:DUF5412 family protein [Alkalihalophilus marmarensis]MEC2074422.1 DUF5412 family protein [Alkalihalophilus marmarensis]